MSSEIRTRFFGGGGFFCGLPALGSQRLGVHAQRLRDARAELIGLNEHRHQRDDVVDAGARAQVAKRLWPGLSCPQFEVDEPQFLRQFRVSGGQFLTDTL